MWLHSTVVLKGKARKLHWPWTGPFRVIQRISDVTYRIQDVQAPRRRSIVHFDRLKYCPKDIRIPHLLSYKQTQHNQSIHSDQSLPKESPNRNTIQRDQLIQENQSLPKRNQSQPGTLLTIIEMVPVPNELNNNNAPQERRYPQRNRHPPERLLPNTEH